MRIHRPPIGALLWDGFAWEGDIHLPRFALCVQTLRSVPVLPRTDYEPPLCADVFPLVVLQEPKCEPTPAQIAAVRILQHQESIICLGVLAALVRLFRDIGQPLWQAEGMANTFVRLAQTLEGMRQTVRLVGVTVFDDATIGYEFAADWAPWEGLGVIMNGACFVRYA